MEAPGDHVVNEKGQVGVRIQPGELSGRTPRSAPGNTRVLPRATRCATGDVLGAGAPAGVVRGAQQERPSSPREQLQESTEVAQPAKPPGWMVAIAKEVDRLGHVRATALVSAAIEEERAHWRETIVGPTSQEAVRLVLKALEDAARTSKGSFVGAHMIALRAAREAGIPGMTHYPTLRRTRAQIERDKTIPRSLNASGDDGGRQAP